jgi:CrcB protein
LFPKRTDLTGQHVHNPVGLQRVWASSVADVPPRPLAHLVAVFGGGLLGTGLRLLLDGVIPHSDSQFPLSTFLINIAGSFVLGLLVSGLWLRKVPSLVKAGVGPGLLGSFTTFSALVLAEVLLTSANPLGFASAALYLVLSLVLGLGAALAGILLGSRIAPGPDPEFAE